MLVKSHGQYNRVIELVFFTTFMMTELLDHVINIHNGLQMVAEDIILDSISNCSYCPAFNNGSFRI